MRVNDITLVSDLDGTIIPHSGIISQKNIDAIRKFEELGGSFAIATGRSPIMAKGILETLGVEGLIIANNGAVIYDVKNQKTVWCKYLDQSYKQVVAYARQKYPNVAVELITDDNQYYIVSSNEITNHYANTPGFFHLDVGEQDYPNNCCKVLFVPTDEEFDIFIQDMLQQNFPDMEFVKSGGNCFEMMAGGVTKGYPFERLVSLYGKKLEHSAAIGDFYNDIEMIKKAAIGAAVGNAVDEVKALASVIVKTCDDDGLADFIDYLIAQAEN
jgi:Cof subfamily protein (haloacid dehalogenase superfamily)